MMPLPFSFCLLFLFFLFFFVIMYIVIWNNCVSYSFRKFSVIYRGFENTRSKYGCYSQYSQLLWKATSLVYLSRTNFHLKASNLTFRCCQSWINTVSMLCFLHEMANIFGRFLITRRYSVSMLLIFSMFSMVLKPSFWCFEVLLFYICQCKTAFAYDFCSGKN